MSTPSTSSLETSDTLLEKSSLYQRFLAEREEILRHKWLKSEEAGEDVGFESALVDWVMHHRQEWRSKQPGLNTASESATAS